MALQFFASLRICSVVQQWKTHLFSHMLWPYAPEVLFKLWRFYFILFLMPTQESRTCRKTLERKTEQTPAKELKGDLTNLAFITFKSQSNLHNFLLTGFLSPRKAALERTATLCWAAVRWMAQPKLSLRSLGSKEKTSFPLRKAFFSFQCLNATQSW